MSIKYRDVEAMFRQFRNYVPPRTYFVMGAVSGIAPVVPFDEHDQAPETILCGVPTWSVTALA